MTRDEALRRVYLYEERAARGTPADACQVYATLALTFATIAASDAAVDQPMGLGLQLAEMRGNHESSVASR